MVSNIFVAKREGSDFGCYVRGTDGINWKFGTIRADGYFEDRFGKDSAYSIEEWINERFAYHMPLDVRLAIVREVYEINKRNMDSDAEAEQYAENAWLRAAENAIPQDDLDFEEHSETMDVGLMASRDAFWANIHQGVS